MKSYTAYVGFLSQFTIHPLIKMGIFRWVQLSSLDTQGRLLGAMPVGRASRPPHAQCGVRKAHPGQAWWTGLPSRRSGKAMAPA